MGPKTVTYWINAKRQIESGLKQCQAQNRADYQRAIRHAENRIREIRQRAGIFI